jgi:hypothetical protein
MAILGGGERDLTIKLLANVDDFKKNMNKAEDQTKSFGDKAGAALKGIGVAVGAAAVAAGAFAVKFGVEAVKAASNLQETVSKVGVIFGDSAGKVEEFAKTAAQTLGQSQQQALDASATFAVFGKSAGLAGDDLVNFSTDFTTLAADLASFNNTTPEQAINAIGSALRGEAEPLRAYGVLLNDATLKQAALELGLISTTNNALTPQQKVLAAQKVIYEQTTDAQGDFARTSDGLANQTRILQARLEDVRTEIGTALLPIVNEMVGVFADQALPVIEGLGDYFIQEMIPDIKANVIPAFEDLIGTIGGLSSVFKDVQDEAKETQFTFSDILFGSTGIVPSFTRATEFLVALGATIIDVLNRIRAFLSGDMDTALRDFDNRFRNNTESINNVNQAMVKAYEQANFYRTRIQNEVTPEVDKNTAALLKQIEALKKQIVELEKGDKAGNSLASSQARLREATENTNLSLKEQLAILRDIGGASFAAAGGAGIRSGTQLQESARSAAEIVSQFGGFIEGFNLLPTDPYYGFGQGSDIRNFPRGSGGTTNVNINVNGTVIDPEGAARAISDVLVRGSARAGNLPVSTVLGIE